MNYSKVNLFLVGAMKAGTTTFAEMLNTHEAIYLSPIKEPNYFIERLPEILYEPSRFFSIEKYFERSFPTPIHIAHVTEESKYVKLFSLSSNEAFRLDASTMYLHAPGAALKMYKYNPDARIIIIKRDPLSRCISHYKMLYASGREIRSFQEVMEEETALYHKGQLPWYSILGMSFYREPISNFTSLFENVLVISLEELIKNNHEYRKKVADFLGISPFDWENVPHKNRSRDLRFVKLIYLLKQLGFKDYFSAIIGERSRQFIYHLISKNESSKVEVSNSLSIELKEIFSKESYI